ALGGLVNASGARLVRDQSPAGGVSVVSAVFFNPRLDGTPYMVAGVFGFVLSFLTPLITAVTIVNERQSGTLRQPPATPATRPRDPPRQAAAAGRDLRARRRADDADRRLRVRGVAGRQRALLHPGLELLPARLPVPRAHLLRHLEHAGRGRAAHRAVQRPAGP